jgi:hypothetical protein
MKLQLQVYPEPAEGHTSSEETLLGNLNSKPATINSKPFF